MFKTVIIIQLFYAVAITMLAYAMPAASLNYVTSFSDLTDEISLESVGTDVQDSLEQQTNMPIIELGALVFYSGNILIDLLLNFVTALPQMFILLIQGIMSLISVDGFLMGQVQLFATVAISVFYLIAIIQILTNVRSGLVI